MPLIIARLNDRAQPLDRGDLYEDPLHEHLQQTGIGEVTGGGTQLMALGEIEFCDVEIEVSEASESTIATIAARLDELGAPKGSRLIVQGTDHERPFGRLEGLAVYLNGTDLPAHVYQECDVNFVYEEFNRLLGDQGSIHSHWQGPNETALYMYGASFEQMRAALAAFMSEYPLCAQARCVQIA
jgi:hypothetical protein